MRVTNPRRRLGRLLFLLLIAAATVTASGLDAGDGGTDTDHRTDPSSTESDQNEFVVAGYLPEWRYEGTDWDTTCAHVTHLILFSMEVTEDAKLTASDRFPHAHMDAIQEASRKHGCDLVLSIGGNKRTGGFPTVAKDKALSRKLARTLLYFVRQHNLHGVDFNWEYPNGEEEWRGLHRLLKITRRVFDRHRDETGTRFSISMAYYPDGRQEKILTEFGASAHVDMAHGMAYDFGPGGHSTMELAKNVVKNLERTGMNKSIATLGLPFYGRSMWKQGWRTYEDLASEHPGLGSQRRGRRGSERGVFVERAGYHRQKSKVGDERRFARGDDLGAGTGFSPRGWAESVGGDRAGGVADGSTETGKDDDQGRALTCVVTS